MRHSLECLASFAQRKCRVDHRCESCFAKLISNRSELRVISHCGSHESPLIPEKPAHVSLHDRTGRASACDEPAAPSKCDERFAPCALSHAVDHNVHAA